MTFCAKRAIISSVRCELRSEDTKTVAVASLDQKGANKFLFSLHMTMRGGDSMYITLAEMLMLITLLIAFAELLLKIFNNTDKK